MTVADNTSRNQYTATSGQALFAYTFEIVDKDDIVVLINGIPLSEGTDYTVTGVGSDTGGNIVLTSGTTGGNIVTIYRDMPYARTQNYTNSGDFLASEVNSDFDSLWLAGEQTNRAFSQSIRKPITDSDSISMELPEAASRANKFVKFDANGAVDLAAGVTTDVAADDVSITDAGGYYTSDNVEGALQEIGAQPPGFDPNTDSFNIGSDAVSSGTDSIALGHDASATAARDIALGLGAVASGGGSIAIGQETDSTGVRSIAIGKGAQSTFSTSIALGEDASTLGGAGGGPIAIGYSATSTGISGISLGSDATASGSQSVSIGNTASASSDSSIALGYLASSSGLDSIALGESSVASGEESIAIGRQATASTNDAVAIGQTATASGLDSIAIGEDSEASGEDGIAIGQETVASGYGSTALGVSADATAQSATALGERALGSALNSTAVGYDAEATGTSSIAIGDSSRSSAVDTIAIGNSSSADAQGAVSIGTGSDAGRIGSIALGRNAQGTGSGSTIAIGDGATTFNGLASPIAIGYQANTTGAYGVGIGYQTVTSGAQGIAIGYIASATNDNGIAIGRQLTVAGQKAIGIGWGAVAASSDSIGIGASANASTADCISIGRNSESLSTGGIAIGSGASIDTTNQYGVAVGYNASATEIGGIAIGHNALCENQFGTALGRDSTAVAGGGYAVALGYGAYALANSTAINKSRATGQRSIAISYDALASGLGSIAMGYNSDALGDNAIAIGNVAGADAANTIHINASGVDTNQPQTAGYIVIETDDAALKYDGSWSLTGGALELPDGIDVTGTVTADALTVDTATGSASPTPSTITIATSTSASDWSTTSPWGKLAFYSADASGGGAKEQATLDVVCSQVQGGVSDFRINTYNSGAKERLRVSYDGNISFYEDTGTTAKFFWDASAERLGIGTSSISTSKLHVQGTTGTASAVRAESTAADSDAYYIADNDASVWTWGIDGGNSDAWTLSNAFGLGTPKLTVKTGGNVGIGTDLPASPLTVMAADVSTVPAAGADSSHFAVGKNDQYGTMIGTLGSGAGYIQQQRFDGTATTYDLLVQPNGGNVGIGTDLPASLVTGGSSPVLSIGGTDSGLVTGEKAGALSFITNDGSYTGTYSDGITGEVVSVSESAVGGAYGLAFYTGTTTGSNRGERLRINASGNVGIGIAYPGDKLHVEGNIFLGTSGRTIYSGGSGNLVHQTGTGSHLWLRNNGSNESMRISSTGSVLVGHTSADFASVGHGLQSSGNAYHTRDGGNPLTVNRKTSDGTIIDIMKDTASVGSIGAAGSRVYISGPSASLHSGLIFTDNGSEGIIAPSTNAGAVANGTTDLGYSGGRFKDGHFSGNINANTFTAIDGVYIGGTGFANKLDDYEEGTFTPVLADATSGGNVSSTTGVGSYTKVGRLVTATVAISNIDTTGLTGSNTVYVRGLPFATSDIPGLSAYYTTGCLSSAVTATGAVNAYAFDGGTTWIGLTDGNNILASDLTSGAADIYFTLSYQTA